MNTKRKILAPIDLSNPARKTKGFLYYNPFDTLSAFTELQSGKTWALGMVVLKGGGIDKNDLFKEIVDSGKKIESVQTLLEYLEEYLTQVSKFKIGDFVGVQINGNEFQLIKLKRPPIKSFGLNP